MTQRAIEMGGACEVYQRACVFVVWHNDDIQASMLKHLMRLERLHVSLTNERPHGVVLHNVFKQIMAIRNVLAQLRDHRYIFNTTTKTSIRF